MIGVICQSGEERIAKEFFELFKTPWEFFRSDRFYNVILITNGEVPNIPVKLLLLYGSGCYAVDGTLGLTRKDNQPPLEVLLGSRKLPIYGDWASFGVSRGDVSLGSNTGAVGVKVEFNGTIIQRIGFDLFSEVEYVLGKGQPEEFAQSPTVELHIQFLRECITSAGVPLIEIPPAPYGFSFGVCLTHDIDFVGIKHHRFDHTMWGFLYRSTFGALKSFASGRISASRLVRIWKAALSLPCVHLGIAKDFWEPFEWYLKLEKGLKATYFVIPFKNRPGKKVQAKNPRRRASSYAAAEIEHSIRRLQSEGCEVGVHGLDAWHDCDLARKELKVIVNLTRRAAAGVRIHWLLRDEGTMLVLEKAGYDYDATVGYNETVGYRAGTMQAYIPPEAENLLEVSTQIQDGALFYGNRLNLTEAEAWERCHSIIEDAEIFGGVVNIIWHDRSHGPERFWGDFYSKLVSYLKARGVWWATVGDAATWFRERRKIHFERSGSSSIRIHYRGSEANPGFTIRQHQPAPFERGLRFLDRAWKGQEIRLGPTFNSKTARSGGFCT